MGNICHSIPSTSLIYDQKFQDRPYPHPYYSVPATQAPQLPFDSTYIASLHNNEPLTPPNDYKAQECTYLEQYYFVKHFDLYYLGQWKKGMPHGKGQIITHNNEYFKGYFSEGVAQGPQCLFVLSPHTSYFGCVQRNQRSGIGVFIDGSYRYEGFWVNNLPHGKGSQTYPNGDTYTGQFLAGSKQGEGCYKWKNGPYQQYRGKFKNNQMCGSGNLKSRQGTSWQGDFNCSTNFIIQKSKCMTNSQLFEGDLVEGQPRSKFTIIDATKTYELKMDNKKMTGKIKNQENVVFQNKIIKYYDRQANVEDIRNIISVIQQGYSNASKHSQALNLIEAALPQYRVSLWREDKPLNGIVIVPICGKYVKVRQRDEGN